MMPFMKAESSENSRVGAMAVRKLLCLFGLRQVEVVGVLLAQRHRRLEARRPRATSPTLVSVGSTRVGADEIVRRGRALDRRNRQDGITGTGTVGSVGGSDRMVGVSGSAGARLG